jgi:hypothetical protein
MTGYQDPKSGGDTFGASEVLTSAQANIIIANQRHFAMMKMMSFSPVTVGPGKIRDIDLFEYSAGSSNAFAWLGATDDDDTSEVGMATGATPAFVGTAHGQTMTNNARIMSVASRPGDAAWFGLQKNGSTLQGYLRWTGSAWTAHNRVYANNVAGSCFGMAYSPTQDVLVAAWDDSIEYNTSGTTWTGVGNVSAGQLKWGNDMFVGCDYDAAVSHVATSQDGQTWNSVAIGATLDAYNHLAHDRGTNKWYLVNDTMANAELTVYASTNGQSWDAVPNVSNPDQGGPGVIGFISYGGIWLVVSLSVAYLSRDEGVSWTPFPLNSGAGIPNCFKAMGGRIFAGFDTPAFYVTDPFVEPLPGD